MLRPWLLVGVAALVGLGCGGAPAEPAPAPSPSPSSGGQGAAASPAGQTVTLQTWCGSLGQSYCGHCMPSDTRTCLNEFLPSCLSDRDPNMMTERTTSETRECGTALEMSDCGAIAAGNLPPICRPQGGAPPAAAGAADQTVTLQTWCDALGRTYCRHCMPGGLSECLNAFVPACLSSRDPNMMTDRTASEVQQCGTALQATECQRIANGELPPVCRSRQP